MARRLTAASKSYDACPAATIAEQDLGDTVYANMIMLGFAWQKGLIPVSARALYRAIHLNGVAAEENLQAFEAGRRFAFDPVRDPGRAPPIKPEAMDLDALIKGRAADLVSYQNQAYADRYLARVAAVRAAESPLGSYRLMAYKDEYEVARLYGEGSFAADLKATLTPGPIKVWLAPPLISRKGRDGRARKMAFGGWMITTGFPILARLKGLRGGPFDLFGASAERRMERELIGVYEARLERLCSGLSAPRLALAVRIASVPDQIRGYGPVKESAIAAARSAETQLWTEWEAAMAS
jgi:indolepyruvate ferredoxin oxidoreductase